MVESRARDESAGGDDDGALDAPDPVVPITDY